MVTELYIGNYRIDILDDVEMSLNFSIADIRDPQTRPQSFSKTIKAPGTGNNAKAFEFIFDIDISGGYNAKLKRDAMLVVDGEVRMQGYAQLKNIIQVDSVVEYELVIIGELSTLYGELGQTYIHQLDFSDLDHALTTANQTASWTATQGEGYYYPMIDYGHVSNRLTWRAIDFFPSVYVKEYIDRMFSLAGKTYTSTFFNSSFFKSLIIPFNRNRLELSKEQILDRTFRASRQLTNQTLSTGVNTLIFNSESHDAGGVYDTGTGVFTVANDGYYTISSVGYMNVTITVTSPDIGATYLPTHRVRITPRIRRVAGSIVSSSVTRSIEVDASNAFATTYTTATDPAYPDDDYPNQVNPPNAVRVEWVNVFLEAGEQYTIEWFLNFLQISGVPTSGTPAVYRVSNNTLKDATYTVRCLIGSFYKVDATNVSLMEGDTVEMAQAIPLNVKCTDFFTSIIKMFNLYVEIDRNDPDNYLIEPWTTFYNNEINDWSELLDRDSDLEIMPTGALNVGEFAFKYKADNDYLNSQYTQAWGEVYGEREIDAETDFYKETKLTELIFSPTPLSDADTGEMPLSTIYKADNNNVVQPYGGNIRILIAGGLKDAVTTWDYVGVGLQGEYPYAGHLDDPYYPTVDINFGVVRQVYYRNSVSEIIWNYNNLYNVYYAKFIADIIHPDSKLVTGYFNLTKLNENGIDFRKLYYFRDQYFRLQRVYDYNPLVPSLTKCEFLKLNDGVAFVQGNTQIVGAYDDGASDITPKLPSALSRDDNSVSSVAQFRSVTVSGSGNYVARSSENIDIQGDDNYIADGARNITITGSGNYIEPEVENVTLINCDNLTVSQSGYYVDGVKVTQPKTYRAILSQTDTNAPTATVIENTLGGGSWARFGTGQYRFTLSSTFLVDKTHILISGNENANISAYRDSDNIVIVETQESDTLALSDNLLQNVGIQILVYS